MKISKYMTWKEYQFRKKKILLKYFPTSILTTRRAVKANTTPPPQSRLVYVFPDKLASVYVSN